MDNLVVENLGKRYQIRAADDDDAPPGADLFRWVGSLFRSRTEKAPETGMRDLWALKDVSFRVQPGTVLGIIGPNGAGKSTLLKMLARVTVPTTGRVVGVGRLVSLLELGAGFDPDISARENVLMNAALNGIPRGDVLKRLDQIAAFADMDQFMETPLKFFSSGMYLRLAFSVAINMDPRILLADEILAVGDLAFQERCLQRVQEGARAGLTVLFVSHDMEAITRVCNRVLWIDAGQVVMDGDPEEVVSEYQTKVWASADVTKAERGRHSNHLAELMGVKLISSTGKEIGAAPLGEPFFIRIRVRTFRSQCHVRCAIDLSAKKTLLFRAVEPEPKLYRAEGIYEVALRIPPDFLAETTYSVTASLVVNRGDDHQWTLVSYNALSFLTYGSMGNVKRAKGDAPGLIAPQFEWETLRFKDMVPAGPAAG